MTSAATARRVFLGMVSCTFLGKAPGRAELRSLCCLARSSADGFTDLFYNQLCEVAHNYDSLPLIASSSSKGSDNGASGTRVFRAFSNAASRSSVLEASRSFTSWAQL